MLHLTGRKLLVLTRRSHLVSVDTKLFKVANEFNGIRCKEVPLQPCFSPGVARSACLLLVCLPAAVRVCETQVVLAMTCLSRSMWRRLLPACYCLTNCSHPWPPPCPCPLHTPDGNWVLSGSEDGFCYIWDADGGLPTQLPKCCSMGGGSGSEAEGQGWGQRDRVGVRVRVRGTGVTGSGSGSEVQEGQGQGQGQGQRDRWVRARARVRVRVGVGTARSKKVQQGITPAPGAHPILRMFPFTHAGCLITIHSLAGGAVVSSC